jgi:hypothetical protein
METLLDESDRRKRKSLAARKNAIVRLMWDKGICKFEVCGAGWQPDPAVRKGAI